MNDEKYNPQFEEYWQRCELNDYARGASTFSGRADAYQYLKHAAYLAWTNGLETGEVSKR